MNQPKDFKSWLKQFLANVIFLAILVLIIDAISREIKPANIPAKIEEVFYTSSGKPVARTSPCYAYYLSFHEASGHYTEGVSLSFDKYIAGCRMICRSGLQTANRGHDYYSAWKDSLKYVSEEEKDKKIDWVIFEGKYLTFYFENGDSLKLFPDNKKIYYDNHYHKAIYAYYCVTPECKELLTQYNVVRMKMDDVFDQSQIRPELRQELKERFDLLDSYKLATAQ